MPRPARPRTGSSGASRRTRRTGSGSPTSPTSRPWPASCTWPSSSTCSAGASSVGPWRGIFAPRWWSRRWRWPWTNGGRSRSSITPIKVASTPRWPSALAAGNGASRCRWVRSAIASIMRWPRASSRPWSASCSTERRCRRTPKHGQRCSSSSRGGTTRGGVTPRSATSRHWSSNGSIRPALWTVPGLWTPYGRPQVRWIPRCARDPHRPQKVFGYRVPRGVSKV